jgi:membrane protein required for colicin V production
MNWLDLVLLLVLAASVLSSFRKGLTREILGLISVIAAILAGCWLYGTAGSFLLPYVSSRAVANFLGFFLAFGATMLLGSVAGFIAGKFLTVTGLSILDHLLGAGFGILRGFLIAGALLLGVLAFSSGDAPPRVVARSHLAPYAIYTARGFAALAPHDLRQSFNKHYQQLKSIWERAVERDASSLPGREEERS